jgi:hypothetical protein
LGDSCCSGGEVVNEERGLIFNNKFNRVFFFQYSVVVAGWFMFHLVFSYIISLLRFANT